MDQKNGLAVQIYTKVSMEKELFDDLMQSLQEASAIARGEIIASRRFNILSDVETLPVQIEPLPSKPAPDTNE